MSNNPAGRFNGKPCLALFGRDGIEKCLREKLVQSLSHSDGALDWLDKYKVSLY